MGEAGSNTHEFFFLYPEDYEGRGGKNSNGETKSNGKDAG